MTVTLVPMVETAVVVVVVVVFTLIVVRTLTVLVATMGKAVTLTVEVDVTTQEQPWEIRLLTKIVRTTSQPRDKLVENETWEGGEYMQELSAGRVLQVLFV